MLRKPSLIGTLLLRMGEVDAMVCGTVGKYQAHLRHVADVIGRRPDAPVFAAMNALLLPNRTLFVGDTYVNRDPSAEELAEITLLAAEAVRRFGLVPKVALLSHSNFGSDDSDSARKMREVRRLVIGAGAGTRDRRRDARRRRAVGGDPRPGAPRFGAEGRGEPADHAEPRRGEHLVQPAQDHRRGRRDHRPDPARARARRC